MDQDDRELLRRYVSGKSEEAFRALVERHLAVIHGAALRQLRGDAHLAQDVVQRVFLALARKAPALCEQPAVIGWLYNATRFETARAIRTETRRRLREQKATLMSTLQRDREDSPGDEAAHWAELGPVVDDAMAHLNPADREALLLRFFSGRSFAEIGYALRLSEDTARKRVERALEKLRRTLARRGIVSTTIALGTALGAHAAVTPPSALAATLAASSWAGLAPAAGTLAHTLAFMSMNKLATGLAAALALVATGVIVHDTARSQTATDEALALQQDLAAATRKQDQLNRELARLNEQLAAQRVAQARTAAASAAGAPASAPPSGGSWTIAPAYQKLSISSSLARRHLEFQRLYRRLGLSADQIEKFEDIMTIQDQANLDAQIVRKRGGDPQTVFRESGPAWSSAMKDLLGTDGFAQLQDYLKTTSVRAFIDAIAGPTAAIGDPLTSDQADQVFAAALVHDAMYQSGKGTDPGNVDWAAVWPAAEKILSADQLALLQSKVRGWLTQQEEQRLLAAKLAAAHP